MTYLHPVLDRLHDDHRQFDALLRRIEALLRAMPNDGEPAPETPGAAALAELAGFVRSYPDALHHRIETALFEAVVNKGLKPAEQLLIQRNLAEHGEIFQATDAAADALAAGADAAAGLSARDQATLADYVALQRQHMAREEDQLFPIAASLLAPTDWQRLEELGRELAAE